jgi:hypothetical protein
MKLILFFVRAYYFSFACDCLFCCEQIYMYNSVLFFNRSISMEFIIEYRSKPLIPLVVLKLLFDMAAAYYTLRV